MDGFNIDNYLRISLTDVVLVLISTFLIVMFARKFFWDKLLNFIQKRQDLIQENIDSSQSLKAEAEQIKEQYDDKMKNAGKEAHEIIESAKATANEEKKQILLSAQNEAALIKEKACQYIEKEKRNAQKEMRNAISDVALQAAKQLIEKEMDEDVQKKYVDDFIDQAGDKQW